MNAVSSTPSTSARAAGWLIVAFATLVVVHTAEAQARAIATEIDVLFSLLLLIVGVVTARALRHLARWAWWTALVIGVTALFFTLPVTGTILLGGGLDPVGTGWDFVFFPLSSAILVALVVALAAVWKERQSSSVSGSRPSSL